MKGIKYIFILWLTANFFLGSVPVAQGFIAEIGIESEVSKRQEPVITRVFDDNWNIVYGFAINCPPAEKTAEIKSAIEEAIVEALQTWLEPLTDEGKKEGRTLVQHFTVYYSPIVLSGIPASSNAFFSRYYFEAAPDGFVGVGRKKVHLRAVFHCDYETGLRDVPYPIMGASEIHLAPISGKWHRIPHTSYATRVLLHEVGHTFGLPDAYSRDAIMSTR